MKKNLTIHDSLIGKFITGLNRSCDLCPLEHNSNCAKITLADGNNICIDSNLHAGIQYPKDNSLNDSVYYLMYRVGGSYKSICAQLEAEGIKTVSDLISYGYYHFMRLRKAGSIVASRLCTVLEEDYGIKDWNRT